MPCWRAQKLPQNLEGYAMNCSSDSGQYSSSPYSPRYLVREHKEQTKYRMQNLLNAKSENMGESGTSSYVDIF